MQSIKHLFLLLYLFPVFFETFLSSFHLLPYLRQPITFSLSIFAEAEAEAEAHRMKLNELESRTPVRSFPFAPARWLLAFQIEKCRTHGKRALGSFGRYNFRNFSFVPISLKLGVSKKNLLSSKLKMIVRNCLSWISLVSWFDKFWLDRIRSIFVHEQC